MKSAIVVLVLLAACSEPLTVKDLAGTYSLTAMDGQHMPQLLTATINCDEWVQSGELTLQETGAFQLLVLHTRGWPGASDGMGLSGNV